MEAREYLTHTELVEATGNDKSESNYKIAADFLLNAVTDWPAYNLKEPVDLVKALRNEIKSKLTFDNLNDYLKRLNPSQEGWRMEAVSSLLEMFDFERKNIPDKEVELEMIIKNVTDHYRK